MASKARCGPAAVAAKAAAAAKAVQRSPRGLGPVGATLAFEVEKPADPHLYLPRDAADDAEERRRPSISGEEGILRLETKGMAPVGSPDRGGSRAPQIFCIADRDDDPPPTSPANFNTIPLEMSGSKEVISALGGTHDGLTEEELRDYQEVQANCDQFRARQSEVEQAVATLLERLNRRVQVPSSAEKSDCGDWEVESLGPTEDGLSFLDSRLGSRAGTPLGGNSPLGSPRDRPTLPTEGFPKRAEPFSSGGFPEPRSRFDGTAPGGSERGDLTSRVLRPSEAGTDSPPARRCTSAPLPSSFDAAKEGSPPGRPPEKPPEEPPAKPDLTKEPEQLPPQPAPDPHKAEPAAEPQEALLEGADLEEGEVAESEVHSAEVAERGEVLPDSASTASSPPRQRPVYADSQRLPRFGSASMCDEETDVERDALEVAATEVPDLDGWHGWTVVATTEGRLFFFHEGMQISQWHQPPELDPILGVWTEARDETQLTRPVFWRNDLLQISLWRDPRETSNIYQAAMDGNLFFLQLFSQVSGDLDCIDHRGCSALHYAAAGGSAPGALFLLQRSAAVDRTDITLTTPLMLTCRYGYPVVLKVLLDAQANPNLADNDGQAPLHQAAELCQLDCLNLLLLAGAQVQQRNVHGETALAIAQKHRHAPCVTLLRRHRQPNGEGSRSPRAGVCTSPGPTPAFPGSPLPRKVAELQQMKDPRGFDEAVPWDSQFSQVGPESFAGYPSRYSGSALPEADSSASEADEEPYYADNSPSRPSWSRQRRREEAEDGLFARLRRRLFPTVADLGLPNLYRYNTATQQWELPPEWEAYLQPG